MSLSKLIKEKYPEILIIEDIDKINPRELRDILNEYIFESSYEGVFYVGMSKDENYPQILSGPFKEIPKLREGHYLYTKTPEGKFRFVLSPFIGRDY